jgi:hypothetical protein
LHQLILPTVYSVRGKKPSSSTFTSKSRHVLAVYGNSTAMGVPALEPEAGDLNGVIDHSNSKKKQKITAEEDAAARLSSALASAAQLRGQRRDRLHLPAQDRAHVHLPRGNPAVARRGQVPPRIGQPPFIYLCSLGTPPFSSKMQGAPVAATGRRHAHFYWLVCEIRHYC